MKDPYILLSYINTLLRDRYQNLDALTEDLSMDKEEIINSLLSIGYEYNESLNQFVSNE